MSNYRRAMFRDPMTWIILAGFLLAVLYIASEIEDPRRGPEPETPVAQETRTAAKVDPPWPDPVYDEQGRHVVMIGDVPLHFPKNIRVLGIGSRDPAGGRKIGVCWTPERFPGKCESVSNRVMMTIKPSLPTAMLSTDEKKAEARSQLQHSTQSFEGPMESDIDGVLEYRGRTHKKPVVYVLKEPDATGRPIVMSCGSGSLCNTHLHVPPALGISITFNRKYVELWPQIVGDVRKLIQSFLVEQ